MSVVGWADGHQTLLLFFFIAWSSLQSINFKLGRWVVHIKIQVGTDLGVSQVKVKVTVVKN